MNLPNFLIIGAGKSGTTALYNYLKQHPQIYMSPVKEPKFFALEDENLTVNGPGSHLFQPITNYEEYCRLFQGVTDEIAIGEASTIYLYVPKASERIKHYIPEVKLVAILRHPVDRAYSSFMHLRRDQREPLADFSLALQEEERRITNNWPFIWRYKDRGFYYRQLKRYFELFNKSQIKIYLYEEFNTNPLITLQDIFKFLNVDENFVPDISTKYNVSGVPKNQALQSFLTKPNFVKTAFKLFFPDDFRKGIKDNIAARNFNKPELPLELRREMLEIYRDDILKLQDLLQRDLSVWLKM
ncbi:MAG: sulfotransferase [Thermosynechococcaceae cyanobacterium]